MSPGVRFLCGKETPSSICRCASAKVQSLRQDPQKQEQLAHGKPLTEYTHPVNKPTYLYLCEILTYHAHLQSTNKPISPETKNATPMTASSFSRPFQEC
jgi:hypothetical protein